jgi:molybdopterin molybdotransferase
MDGFAVRAEDLSGASREQPVSLKLMGEIPAGTAPSLRLGFGECVRVFTGSPLPFSADAVLMQEDTVVDENDPQKILCLDAVKPWENLRLCGEDVKSGATILQPGERLGTGSIALLAAMGFSQTSVARRPMVGLIATGNELLEPGEPFTAGKIYESNRAMLLNPLYESGAVPRIFSIVADSLDQTFRVLEKALTECDAVITTGGVSVGAYDFVKAAFERIGGKLDFWKVAIKPGKPFVFGTWRNKFLFGLPGNPVSALITFLLLVRPALLRWQGASQIDLPSHPGNLTEPLSNPADRRHFVRVQVDAKGEVHSAGFQASHSLSSLARANGLVDISPRQTLPAGASVEVLRWEF